jgi:hypothetical protein
LLGKLPAAEIETINEKDIDENVQDVAESASVSANNINSPPPNLPKEKSEENVSSNSFKRLHTSGSGELGMAFKFGNFLFARAKPKTSIKLEWYYLENPDETYTEETCTLFSFSFAGELIKPGDGTFSFEGDSIFLWHD